MIYVLLLVASPPVVNGAVLSAQGDAKLRTALSDHAPSARAELDTADLDALVSAALDLNPIVRAARQRVDAARARLAPAGLPPDPMLMVGLQNFPIADPGFGDFMTMKMIGVAQRIPYPGKLGLQRRVAERQLAAVEASLLAAEREVTKEVRTAYYELAFLDRALEIVERNQRVLTDFIRIAEARYSVGVAGQQDVLRARVEATRLTESAVTLTEQRRATLARLNAALDRASEAPVLEPRVPERVARAAVADSATAIRFVSAALGSRVAESPLLSLSELQESALRESPVLREHEELIGAQGARVELARREYLPDFDLGLAYGQRTGFGDMLSVTLTVPLPIHKHRRQDAYAAEARAELSALEAEHHAHANDLRASVASLHAEAERQRAQLALYKKAIIPQGSASLASALSGYRVGRIEFLTVLDSQATLFGFETEYFRALTDFAITVAELERVVGKEILR